MVRRDPARTALAKTQLGVVRYLTGDQAEAETLPQQALSALQGFGVPDDEAETLNHLGIHHRLTARPDRAHTYHTEALTLARRIHHRHHEAHALEGRGRTAIALVNPTAAITHLRHALDLYQQLGVTEADNVAVTLAGLA